MSTAILLVLKPWLWLLIVEGKRITSVVVEIALFNFYKSSLKHENIKGKFHCTSLSWLLLINKFLTIHCIAKS